MWDVSFWTMKRIEKLPKVIISNWVNCKFYKQISLKQYDEFELLLSIYNISSNFDYYLNVFTPTIVVLEQFINTMTLNI